jgi:hypothetical protein
MRAGFGLVRSRWVGVLCAALFALSACTAFPGGDTAPPAPPIVEVAKAKHQVRAYADRLVAVIGDTRIRKDTVVALHCDGKPQDWYFASGVYQIFVPAEQHSPAFDRLKQYAGEQGYTVDNDHRIADGRGDVTVSNPRDGYTLTASSGEAPAMVLIINSPCYRTDKPLH